MKVNSLLLMTLFLGISMSPVSQSRIFNTHGLYLQGLTEDEVTIVWTTNGEMSGSVLVKAGEKIVKDDGGFNVAENIVESFPDTYWWKTDMLPEPLRHTSGHDGSHCFITHEFIDSIVNNRTPEVDIYQALAMTVPGIVAHQSALKGGEHLKIPSFDI